EDCMCGLVADIKEGSVEDNHQSSKSLSVTSCNCLCVGGRRRVKEGLSVAAGEKKARSIWFSTSLRGTKAISGEHVCCNSGGVLRLRLL
ncbi:hypothetical protein KUCAC02_023841, partial [Chaenocephalus aceratus]